MKTAVIAAVFFVAGLAGSRLSHPAVANAQKETGFPPAYIEEADDVSRGVGRVSLGWGGTPIAVSCVDVGGEPRCFVLVKK
ncbi:exported hypothetical protein [Candidatus Sulfotelmatobacter sp. SbA7]|nr:exported hypothetical protein [Candidatus Sulfotelmatobacter sp. SbA7]